MVVNIHRKVNYCTEKLALLHFMEIDNIAQLEIKLMNFNNV